MLFYLRLLVREWIHKKNVLERVKYLQHLIVCMKSQTINDDVPINDCRNEIFAIFDIIFI